ncbi:MAG: hypothetical protein GX777_00155, partial [Fastidiosipila sp.]|nr:hypothetical protein [Fastidiosipila sp.]
MTIKTTFISSDNMNNDPLLKDKSRAHLDKIQAALGEPIIFATPEEQQGQGCVFIFVASGGSEMAFIDVMKKLPGYVCLISTDNNSSLAASMEMLAWLRENGRSGEILHGTLEQVVSRLKDIAAASEACQRFIDGRLGVIGRADERIASFIDEEGFEAMTGAPIDWISMEELLTEYEQGGYPDDQWTRELMNSGYDEEELEKALT